MSSIDAHPSSRLHRSLRVAFVIGATCLFGLLRSLPASAAEPVPPVDVSTPPASTPGGANPGTSGEASPPQTPSLPVEAEATTPLPVPSAPAEAAQAAPPSEPAQTTDSRVDVSGAGLFERSLTTEALADPSASTHGAEPKFELNGYIRGDSFVGKVPGFRQGEMKAAYGELALKVQGKKEDYGDAYAEARLRYGLQGHERALIVDLREAYVNVYFGRLELRLGHQIIVWGRADGFNPTNNLTPFDLRVRSPIEDDRRVGNVGARGFVKIEPIRIEAVWLPLYSPAELPPIELDEFVAFGEPSFPAPELKNGLGALRVHLELPAFELSASYLYGYAPLPGVALQGFTVGEDPPRVTVSRTAYDHHVVGFDFSTAIGDLLAVRAEAAYRRPIDYQHRVYAPRPDLQYVFGVDRSFASVNAIVQYMGRYVFDWQREAGPDNPIDPAALAGFTAPLPLFLRQEITTSIEEELQSRNQGLFSQTARVQHLASLRLEWLTLHDTLSISGLSMLNFTTKEWLFYPKLGVRISDAMTGTLGAEIYLGPEDTLFGLVDEELSAGYAELRFAF